MIRNVSKETILQVGEATSKIVLGLAALVAIYQTVKEGHHAPGTDIAVAHDPDVR